MQIIKNAIEAYRQLILDTERAIWAHPETGFKEWDTSKYMEKVFEDLGYTLTRAGDIPGFYTRIATGRPGPEVLVLAELDSVICPAHPDSDPATGAVHSCGHNAQCAAMAGIAAALTRPEVLQRLSGSIRLCLVPAEELLEVEYRSRLKKEGKIKYLGGKAEFLSRGHFDGVDLAFLVHSGSRTILRNGYVGCMAKNIIYKGTASHAGCSPWDGHNALYAATCGINAVNAIRETFREPDIIRVHPIITKGGDMVNAIPEEVRLESYVRGSSFQAITRANKTVDQALIGAALSLGTNIEIIDTPGYAPMREDAGLVEVAKEAADRIIPHHNCIVSSEVSSGSTDMGDLSSLMPAIHPHCGGTVGNAHGKDFFIPDPEKTCVDSAKWQMAMLQLLLGEGAERAKKIVAEYDPAFPSKEAYLAYLDSLNRRGDRITYGEGGTVTVEL